MAAIDKTYVKSYEDYKRAIDWAKTAKFTLKTGEVVHVIDFVYYPDITKEEWEEYEREYLKRHPESKFYLVLWNTPIYLDIYLIKNCPIDFIQETLKEQYSGGCFYNKTIFDPCGGNDYESIKNGTSVFDTYQRNGLGKKSKIKFKSIFGKHFHHKNLWWWIQVIDPKDKFFYDSDGNYWSTYEEGLPGSSCLCNKFHGKLSKKAIVRLIKKWDFPKNTKIKFTASSRIDGLLYDQFCFETTVK